MALAGDEGASNERIAQLRSQGVFPYSPVATWCALLIGVAIGLAGVADSISAHFLNFFALLSVEPRAECKVVPDNSAFLSADSCHDLVTRLGSFNWEVLVGDFLLLALLPATLAGLVGYLQTRSISSVSAFKLSRRVARPTSSLTGGLIRETILRLGFGCLMLVMVFPLGLLLLRSLLAILARSGAAPLDGPLMISRLARVVVPISIGATVLAVALGIAAIMWSRVRFSWNLKRTERRIQEVAGEGRHSL